jgi:hypothetical protein
MTMDTDRAADYFDQYIKTFYRCVAGAEDFRAMLSFYRVPFSFTSNHGFSWLPGEQDVLAFVGHMIERLRADGYASTETLKQEFLQLNKFSAQCAYSFVRRRGDGSELERMTVRYLIAQAPEGTRIITFAANDQATA